MCLKESVIWSAMSSPCWSLCLTFSLPVTALARQYESGGNPRNTSPTKKRKRMVEMFQKRSPKRSRNWETGLRKKPWNKSDAPAEMRGKWLNVSTSSKKRTKPLSIRLQKFGHYQRHLRFRSINAHTEEERSELN